MKNKKSISCFYKMIIYTKGVGNVDLKINSEV